MKFAIILTLLISFEIKAQDDCVPLHNHSIDGHFHKLLEWFGANDKQISEAPCKSKTPPSESEIAKLIQSRSNGKKSASIHGVQFKDEAPELIEAFKHFTTAYDQMGFREKKEDQKEIQTEYKINPECDKVMCAMEKIWGKEMGGKMMFLKLKHGYNTSELAFANSDRFTKEELDDVILGVEDLPRNLAPLGKDNNQRLTRFVRGYTLENYSPTVVANAVVMLFDAWSKDSSASRQYTIFHEMAHNVGSKLNRLDDSPEWHELSGWIKKGDNWEASPDGCFASKYGKTNPWEDFAESLSTYRYNGNEIKTKCPEKFEFLKKNVFKGIEYTEANLCAAISEEQIFKAQKLLGKELMDSLGQKKFTEKDLEASCKGELSGYPIPGAELSKCSLKLHTSKLDPSKVKEALEQLGIEDLEANRDLIIDSLYNNLSKDEELLKNLEKKSQSVIETVDSVVQKSFLDVNPKDFSQKELKADGYEWSIASQKCGEEFFRNSSETTKECIIKQIVAEDRTMQKWNQGHFPTYKKPDIFKEEAFEELSEKRDAALLEYLKKHPTADEAYQIKKKEFKAALMNHQLSVKVKLYNIKDWKKMEPEAFCKITYGASSAFTMRYGFAEGDQLPVLFEKCIEIQSTKSRRHEINDSDWQELVNTLLQ